MNYISLVESNLFIIRSFKVKLIFSYTITCVCMSVCTCVINVYIRVHVQVCWPVLACICLWRAEDHVRSSCLFETWSLSELIVLT